MLPKGEQKLIFRDHLIPNINNSAEKRAWERINRLAFHADRAWLRESLALLVLCKETLRELTDSYMKTDKTHEYNLYE